jgi:DNA polymerase (family 10)
MPESGPQLDNAGIAAALNEYAALLELAGAGPYTSRAFRRAAELIASTPLPVATLVRAGRVRELRGIGPGIEAKLRELSETGQIAEVEELRRDTFPELAALGRLLGFGARTGATIGAALGIETAEDLRAAVAAGRLRSVPGIGPRTEAKIVAALAREPTVASRPLRLDRAREQSDELARALGGTAAGDPRRWKDAPARLAVVVASDDEQSVQARFAALPQIVAVLGPYLGVTADGVPVELVVAPSERLGTALVRATGSAEYVAWLGPLPDAPDEESLYRLLGRPYTPPELRETPVPAVPPSLLEVPDLRGDLHCHTLWSDGKATVREMAEAALGEGTSTSRSATTPEPCASCPASTRTTSGGRPSRSTRRTPPLRRSGCSAASNATSSPTAASTCPTTFSRSSTGFSFHFMPASARRARS